MADQREEAEVDLRLLVLWAECQWLVSMVLVFSGCLLLVIPTRGGGDPSVIVATILIATGAMLFTNAVADFQTRIQIRVELAEAEFWASERGPESAEVRLALRRACELGLFCGPIKRRLRPRLHRLSESPLGRALAGG